MGYCTLYGDMVGALAVIGDVVKTRGLRLCRWLNREREVIPAAILEKPPSAELAPGPEGYRLAAALRGARSRSSRPTWSATRRRSRLPAEYGFRRWRSSIRWCAGGALRVQAAAGGAGAEGHSEVVRHGPPVSHRRQGSGIGFALAPNMERN